MLTMNDGLNPRTPRVTFKLEPPADSVEKMFGHRPSVENTAPTAPTTTPQVSSRERLLAELLRDLSGSKFPDLASALLPQLGSRGSTRRRRTRRPTTGSKRRSRPWESESEDSYSEGSGSFSSGAEDSDGTCFSTTPELQISPIGSDEETSCSAAQTRLAPLPGQANFRGLGPRF